MMITNKDEISGLTRPIIGIENRTSQEVFDIMCGRIQAATALRLSAGGGWRTMDSAPEDGTKILVWADGYEWPEVIYYERYDDETAAEAGETGYWRYADDLLSDIATVEFDTLSRWQPLPPPPASPTVEAGHVE